MATPACSTAPSSASPTSRRARSRWPPCSSTPTAPSTAEELQRLVADTLATYKQLRQVVVVDAIPRLPSGKVLRRVLRDEWSPNPWAVRLMDVRLSPEQQALRDSAAQVAARLGPSSVGALDDAERVAKLDATVAATGWRELRAADEGDPPLASAVEVAIVAEELGRGLADTAFLGPTLAAELRRLAGAPAGAESRDRRAAADLAHWPTDRPAGRSPSMRPAPPRRWSGDADGAGDACPRRRPTIRVDLTRPAAVPPVRSRPSAAPPRRRRPAGWTALGLAVTCADLVGTMQGAVDLAMGYAAERHQYGVPVGSFQAVQHLLADAFVATEGSRSVTLHAAWAVDALPPDEALAAAAVAKAYCARAARDRLRDRDPGPRRHRQHLGVPRPRSACRRATPASRRTGSPRIAGR